MQPESLSNFRKWITFVALVLATIHILFPAVAFDVVTLVLLGFAILPWLSPMFKSLEFPGGFKVEFPDLERMELKADKAGLLASPQEVEGAKHTFELVAATDPNLALAGLRIEIEKRLRRLAESNDIPARSHGLGRISRELLEHGLLLPEEESTLAELNGLLNQAVHGADVTESASSWAMSVGPRLLAGLDAKIDAARAASN